MREACMAESYPAPCSKANGEVLSEGASANGSGLPGDLGDAAAKALDGNGTIASSEPAKGDSLLLLHIMNSYICGKSHLDLDAPALFNHCSSVMDSLCN